MKNSITIVVTGLVLCFLLAARPAEDSRQAAAADFRKVNEAYSKAVSLGMNVQYRLYPNYTASAPEEEQLGEYKKQGNSFYSNLLGIITIENDHSRLSVNTIEKTIILSDPVKKNKNPAPLQLDSVLKKCSAVEFSEQADGKKFYRLKFERTPYFEYNMIELSLDNNAMITKLVLFYREALALDEGKSGKKEKPRLEITYSAVTTAPVISNDLFSEKKYVVVSGKTVQPAPAYTGYKVLNLKK